MIQPTQEINVPAQRAVENLRGITTAWPGFSSVTIIEFAASLASAIEAGGQPITRRMILNLIDTTATAKPGLKEQVFGFTLDLVDLAMAESATTEAESIGASLGSLRKKLNPSQKL